VTSQYDLIFSLELKVLRALCTHPNGERYENCSASLGSYVWKNGEHRAVYEALRRIGFLPPNARRRELPAEMTRLGFPDVNCGDYFDGENTTPDEFPQTIQFLLLHSP
jgi:hypothetical protein